MRADMRKIARQTRQRTTRSDPTDDRIDIVLHLRPDLGSGRALVRHRVGRIAELVGVERARNIRSQARRHVLVILGMSLVHVRARHPDFGAERFQMQHFLGRHLVRNHQQHAIAFGARDQRETEARIAGSGLHDNSPGFQAAVRFGGRDHGKRDAVLDRAAWVLTFQLDEQAAAANVKSSDLDQWRVADQAQDGRIAARGVG